MPHLVLLQRHAIRHNLQGCHGNLRESVPWRSLLASVISLTELVTEVIPGWIFSRIHRQLVALTTKSHRVVKHSNSALTFEPNHFLKCLPATLAKSASVK